MGLRVFNTMSGQMEEFVPLHEKQVGLYVCGPTVYDWAHLGHARTYLAFDVIVRWLEFKGYSVFYVQNITDVGHLTTDTAEDKITKRAIERKVEPMQLVEFYMREYFKDLDALGVKRPDISPRATGHLLDMIDSIQSLLKNGFAYEVNGNVFFDISKLADYGKLSKIKLDEMLEGSRFEVHSDKKNSRDFALWKRAEPETVLKWWSPWGYGFPGWHIECAVMGLKYLGKQFDIHGGARDLIFPHHENEIAQSESITGTKPFVKYWLHTGFLKINGEKMAKSLGNYITVRDALKKHSADAIRLFVMSTHYRSEIDFTDERLKGAETSLNRLYSSLESLEDAKKVSVKRESTQSEQIFSENVAKLEEDFVNAMDEDFNTPQALAALFDMSKEINRFLAEQKQVSSGVLEQVYYSFSGLGKALGLFQQEKPKDVGGQVTADLVHLLFDLREELRKKGEYDLSDEIRARMKKTGLIIEDTAEGPKWKLV
ncbi:MAG: cysteine--tRNA ligase [Candidatus Bathyarchaeota archaeon]|nr:cysteine--tRNA ligase [Candidatus Bathyarchaeum tardum]WGM89510.1 MAG: cysteine--tRNA ligase [Candidatus Bathyarchaeum tardum]WNZ28219.1 MAG: cysteine--tRNA ligase [Candidatus Bathyarchaeota archaeon]